MHFYPANAILRTLRGSHRFFSFLKKTAVPIFALITNIVNVIFVILDVVSVQCLEILGPKTRVIELDRRIVIGQIHPSELG